MFTTYLRRELKNRRRQTAIVAIGMALAIALVILVNSLAGGVKNAQASALQSVYGVGTDVTVSKTATAPSGTNGQRFQFGAGAGTTKNGTQKVSTSRLATAMGTTAFASTAVAKAAATTGVASATGVLSLNSTTFSGSIPSQSGTATGGAQGAPGGGEAAGGAGGPSSFGVTSISVVGYDTATTAGPISSTTLVKGRSLKASDAGTTNVVLDQDYATSAKKAVGGTVTLGGTKFTVVGIVKSTSTSSASGANTYISLATAQKVSGDTAKVTGVYVTATSSNDVTAVKTALTKSLGTGYTVNTQADLASTVSGSLSTASSLATTLGTWLSILVLAAAFLIAVLFTVSGVTRRTREFGTLKAIGWSNRRVVGQVAGESLVQGLIGGAVGIALGLIGILVVNLIHPSLTATATTAQAGPGGQGGPGGGMQQAAAAASSIALSLPVTGGVLLLAVALAVVGGLIAGAFGGWRATSLRPAAALRSVA